MKKRHKKNWGKLKLVFHFSASVFTILTVSTFCLFGFYSFVHRMPSLDIKRLPPHSEQYVLATVSLIIGVILSFAFNRFISIPLQKIYSALEQISEGDYDVNLTPKGIKGLRTLTRVINGMSKELNGIETMRNDFINNFSHEFKTPIVSISGFAKILKDENLTPEQRNEYLEIIISESSRLADLSSSVLSLSRLDNQTTLPNVNEFNVAEQIRLVVVLLEQKWASKNITVDFDSKDYIIFANEEMLQQLWINLIDNAIKFSPENSEICISVKKHSDELIFTFSDQGKGMNEEARNHAFERFYQGDLDHKVSGNGIGLAMAKKICELHGGFITIRSTNETGTTFEVVLPTDARNNPGEDETDN